MNAHWRYQVEVTNHSGKPMPARITVQLADPFGGVHPVQFDCCNVYLRIYRSAAEGREVEVGLPG